MCGVCAECSAQDTSQRPRETAAASPTRRTVPAVHNVCTAAAPCTEPRPNMQHRMKRPKSTPTTVALPSPVLWPRRLTRSRPCPCPSPLAPPLATLFRCYPGPWQLLRRNPLDDQDLAVLWSSERQPSLKEVALEILPAVWR